MNYELSYLSQLIKAARGEIVSADESLLTDSEAIQRECKRILEAMLTTDSRSTAQTIQCYVRMHQAGLIAILEDLQDSDPAETETSDKSSQELKISAIASVAFLLESIAVYFSSYLDASLPLPAQLWVKRKEAINRRWTLCLSRLSGLALSEKLIGLLNAELTPKTNPFARVSSSELDYLEQLTRQILNTIDQAIEPDNWDLITTLLEAGFNAPRFYKYCCAYLMEKSSEGMHLDELYRSLSYSRKLLKQIQPASAQQYLSSVPGILESLLKFTQAEIEHLKDIDIIASDLAGSGMIDRNFRVAFTVKQLAFFIHLQVECGIILEERPKNVHKYVTSHYATRDQETISEKSFKNAYYAQGTDDVNKVIAKLSEMLAIAQDTFK